MGKLKYNAKRRRALNIVWDVSEDYRFDPDFVAYTEQGAPDLYLNAVVGLTRKYYDVQEIHNLFEEMKGSAMVDTFTDLLWLGLEKVTYEKEVGDRPVLEYLRKQHAYNYFQGKLLGKSGVAHEMQAARWHEVLGEKLHLHDPWAKSLYKALDFDPSWDTKTMCDYFRHMTKKYFVSHFLVRESLEKVIIGKGLADIVELILPHFYRQQESIFNFLYSKKDAEAEISGKNKKNGLMARLTGSTAEENYRYIVDCFGSSIYTAQKMLDIEKAFCQGPHEGSHLHFTRGRLGSKGAAGEASRWLQGALKQRVKNVAYYKDHGEQCRKAIAKLTNQLRSAMRMTRAQLPVAAKEGDLVPGLVWRAVELGDSRIFYDKEVVMSPDFTVDIMLDASASRGEYQSVIASQAFVLAEALRQCNIPYQVYSFCTLRSYTVLTVFKTYEEKKKCDAIFNYVATGWNRDGLALRGARQLMGDFNHTKKILIMLTDAQPNDDKPLRQNGVFLNNAEYRDEKAIADTADEAAALRREGIRIIGLINDEIKGGMKDARTIFGQDCVEVKELDKLADSVGKILCRQIGAF